MMNLIDVREAVAFAQDGIAGAINIPLGEIGNIAAVIADKQAQIKVYCQKGIRSVQAQQLLTQMGYSNVISIGGIEEAKQHLAK